MDSPLLIKASASAEERDRIFECPICLNPLSDNVVYLSTNPDEPYKRYTVCTHAFCENCIADVLATAEREKRVPECSYCRRKILGVIRSELSSALIRENTSLRANANKQGEGYRGIIAELNNQKKKLKEELATVSDQLQKRTTQCRELEERCEAAVREAHSRALQLETDLAAAVRERDAAREEVAAARRRTEEEIRALEGAQARHADECAALQRAADEARAALQRQQKAGDEEQKAMAARLAADNARVEEALQAERATVRQLRDEVARVTAAARAADAEAQSQRQEAARNQEIAREAASRQLTELDALQRNLAAATAENERLRAAATAAAQEAQRAGDWEPQRDAYERQLGAARQALIDKENECFSLDQHRVALQQQLAEHSHQVRKLEAQLEQMRRAHDKAGKQPANSYYGLGTVLSVAGGWLSAAAGSAGRGLFLRPVDFSVLSDEPLPAAAALQKNALGPVYKAREVANGRLCMVVQVRVPARNSERVQLALAREATLLSRLAHQNLVRLDGLLREPVLDGWQFGMVLSPLVPDTLEHTLRTYHFESRDVRALFQQILSLLAYLHAAQVVLRTLHSSMFLFVKQSGTLKLMSLSTARSLHSEPFDALPPHTLPYWAPELLYITTSGTKAVDWKAVDSWAAGALFAEILAGRRLFEDCSDSLSLLASLLGVRDFRPAVLDERVLTALPVLAQEQFKLAPVTLADMVPTASGPALELIARLMCLHPPDRLNPRSATQHSFFSQTAFPAVSECKFERDLSDAEISRWAEHNGLFK